jgi:hypothetical protein
MIRLLVDFSTGVTSLILNIQLSAPKRSEKCVVRNY